MKTAINIILSWLTCTDPVVVEKWTNIAASFWHKDEGQVVTELSSNGAGDVTIKAKDGDGVETSKTIVKYVEPSTFEISKINGLQSALDGKVATEPGKGLSANDFTTTLKNKLEALTQYVHPASHTIAEVDGLQTALDDINQALVDIDALFSSLANYQYIIWNGYRLYKNAGNVQAYPEAGEELKGRGDGSLFGGEIVHITAKINNPAKIDADFNLLNSYP